MRDLLNDETKALYDRHHSVALLAGCDNAQAHSIAKERTLSQVMRASAAITARRESVMNLPTRRRSVD